MKLGWPLPRHPKDSAARPPDRPSFIAPSGHDPRRKGRPEDRHPPYLASSRTAAIPGPRPLSSSPWRAASPQPCSPATQRAVPGRGAAGAPGTRASCWRRGSAVSLPGEKAREPANQPGPSQPRQPPLSPPSWAFPCPRPHFCCRMWRSGVSCSTWSLTQHTVGVWQRFSEMKINDGRKVAKKT